MCVRCLLDVRQALAAHLHLAVFHDVQQRQELVAHVLKIVQTDNRGNTCFDKHNQSFIVSSVLQQSLQA